MADRKSLLGKLMYGAVFVVLLPAILLYWVTFLDRAIHWPVPNMTLLAAGGIAGGIVLLLGGMVDLAIYGQGLPMNAYPPKKFVTQGMYRLFSHPMYLGAVLLSAGSAMWLQSSSGLYIVTPILALMTTSFVYGYERLALNARFGSARHTSNPLFSFPHGTDNTATWPKKSAMCLRIFLPWVIVGYAVDYARCGRSCTAGAYTGLLNPQSWQYGWSVLWVLPFLYLAMRLFTARTSRDLLHWSIAGTLATAVGMYLYVILPASGVDVSRASWILPLVSIVVVLVAAMYRRIWAGLQSASEWVGNSRHDWLLANGHFRIINHSLYSGLAGAVAVGILSYVIGNPFAALILLVCGAIGAAIFAQVLWGSNLLARPFGYWGGVIGGVIGALLVAYLFDISFSRVALAAVLCAPFTQAIGRLRCLVQGCCHGVVTSRDFGIRIWQSQSRVVALSGLKGQYILNTQLYSILFDIPLGFLLWAAWLSQSVGSSFIIGLYLILTGIERFAEDAYRGEKQTRFRFGLRENQWIALGAALIGMGITLLPSVSVQPSTTFTLAYLAAAVTGGLLAAFAMSMDFPKSTMRYSRLSG